jgi:hypothetical protein
VTDLFIASKARIDHDGSRRVIAAGALIGDDVHVNGPREASVSVAIAVIAGRLERELAEAAVRGEP